MMIKYAANDVIYLPKIYRSMISIIKDLNGVDLQYVMDCCELYLQYPELNNEITQKNRDLQENSQIQGLIK